MPMEVLFDFEVRSTEEGRIELRGRYKIVRINYLSHPPSQIDCTFPHAFRSKDNERRNEGRVRGRGVAGGRRQPTEKDWCRTVMIISQFLDDQSIFFLFFFGFGSSPTSS